MAISEQDLQRYATSTSGQPICGVCGDEATSASVAGTLRLAPDVEVAAQSYQFEPCGHAVPYGIAS